MNEQEREAFEVWWNEHGLGPMDAQREAWQARAALAAKAVPADLRRAAERTREDLGPTGSNYPDIRVLLAFAEQALAGTPPAPEATPAQAQQAERAHPYGHCTITGPAEDVAFIFRHLPDVDDEKAPDIGWTGNPDADLALILLDRLDDEGDGNPERIEQLEGLVRKMAQDLATKAEAKPLTEQEVAEAVFDYYQHFIDPQDAAEACFDKDLAMFRLAERACAEAWGVKLVGIGGGTKERGNAG